MKARDFIGYFFLIYNTDYIRIIRPGSVHGDQ